MLPDRFAVLASSHHVGHINDKYREDVKRSREDRGTSRRILIEFEVYSTTKITRFLTDLDEQFMNRKNKAKKMRYLLGNQVPAVF